MLCGSAGIVFTQQPMFCFFCPVGVTCCTDQSEIWPGGADCRSTLYQSSSNLAGGRGLFSVIEIKFPL